ncbi:glycosyltransferase [Marinobacter xestospongiae]|uniref:Glycosyltransferase n=1 Tax=Marinobacter xestospongiae TaxID=994319 RepID=A0ABU3W142_9GAMM|nr:glycosyltransferase [Marinobacter xestospongiae]MDV2079731.1 glycosyltransferase [Marinobacter xestospongiae]
MAKTPIRITHVTFNMGIGGTEQVIRQLVSNLPPSDFCNQIVCIDGQIGEIGQQLSRDGIELRSVPRQPGFDWQLVRALRDHIREFDSDLVHCHQYTPWVYGWLAARGTGARVVFTEHGRFHPDRRRYKAMLINPMLALLSGAVVAISRATREALHCYEFLPRRGIRVIYNGIRGLQRDAREGQSIRQSLGIPGQARVVGTVARLDPVKNQGMMLAAFAELASEMPDLWLLMVGDGPDRAGLERQAEQLGLAERIVFTGFIDQPAQYLATMDLFLLSSHTEGTSMTLLEAMSLGVPAVCTEVGGNPEIVADGETGLLTPPGDSAAFAEAMRQLLTRPELYQRLASNSRDRFAKRFSVDHMLAEYSAIYHSLA